MFKRKPPLPHCEHLTTGQQKAVRKMLAQREPIFVWAQADKLLRKNEHDTLLAFARQPDARKASIDNMMTAVFHTTEWSAQHAELAIGILPELERYGADYLGGQLASFLFITKHNLTMRTRAIEAVSMPRARGYAAKALISKDMSDTCKQAVGELLASGADLHIEKAALMKALLRHEQYQLADKVMALGFDLSLYAGDLTKYVIEEDVPHQARIYLDGILREKGCRPITADTPVALAQASSETPYLLSGDSVSRIDRLPDGGSLTTVFNFATRQQIVIAHVAGQTAAPVVTPFAHIEGGTGLSDAAAAFVALGGDAARIENLMPASGHVLIEKPKAITGKPAQ